MYYCGYCGESFYSDLSFSAHRKIQRCLDRDQFDAAGLKIERREYLHQGNQRRNIVYSYWRLKNPPRSNGPRSAPRMHFAYYKDEL